VKQLKARIIEAYWMQLSSSLQHPRDPKLGLKGSDSKRNERRVLRGGICPE